MKNTSAFLFRLFSVSSVIIVWVAVVEVGILLYSENDFSYCVVISFIVLPFLSKKKKTEGYL